MENKFKELSDFFQLNKNQIEIIKKYISFLNEENKKYNLTGFKNEEEIFYGNIKDALFGTISNLIKNKKNIADVGTGAGIPGLVLAIKYPEKNFYLIEVQKKRIIFLEKALNLLEIKNCKIVDIDYRSFLRKKLYEVDLFITRASLKLNDLLFLFSNSSKYNKTSLVYWASKNWNLSIDKSNLKKIKINENKYLLKNKERYILDISKNID